MTGVENYLEAALVLLVVGLAMIWPPLALIGGAAFFGVLGYVNARRQA